MSRERSKLALAAVLTACWVGGCLPVELSVSPGGKIMIPRQEGFCEYDPAKGTVQAAYIPKDQKAVFAQYSPDGKEVLLIHTGQAAGMGTGFVAAVMPAAGGEPKQVYAATNITYAQWSRNGKFITFTRLADDKTPPLDESLPQLVLVNLADGSSKQLLSNASVIHRWLDGAGGILTMQVQAKDQASGHYTGKIVQVDPSTGNAKPLASVVSGKDFFLTVSDDGRKALFTAIKAGKVQDTLTPGGKDETQLFELLLPDGQIRAVNPKAEYAIFSPKGTKVLVGSPGGGELVKLEVFDAAMAKGTGVAADAAKTSGSGPDTVKIFPSWLDDNTVLYLQLHASYGTACKNFRLVTADAEGKARKNHQAIIDGGIKN